ncbi:MAG: radical SAM protein [Candidatus Omnitrophica bacterium]|nr:radical SAM protein [Candidatus Omnitrophota bacterium]
MSRKTYFDLLYRLKDNIFPLRAQIALTYRCNLNCVHCFENKDSRDELTLSEIKDILNQLKDLGCLRLNFTGGELFLRKDVLEIFELARRMNFDFSLITNATLLTEGLVRNIKKFNPSTIQISLYGATKKVYESISNVSGSFKKTLDAISLLKVHNLKLRIATVVMRQNFHEIKIIRQMARINKWNLITDYCISPGYNGSRVPLKCRMTQNQLKKAVTELKSEGRYLKKMNTISKERLFCLLSFCQHECYISAQADVFPSCTLRMKLGSLREKSFEEIWRDSQVAKTLRGLKKEELYCLRCRLFFYCCFDKGMAWLEHGDFRLPAKEICRVMKAGIRRDGKLLPPGLVSKVKFPSTISFS